MDRDPACPVTFDLKCCVEHGHCCEVTFDDPRSIGNCDGILCGEKHAPAGSCGAGGECVPGSRRACLTAVSTGASWDNAWGEQTCGADGRWPRTNGSCVPGSKNFCPGKKIDPFAGPSIACCAKNGYCCAVDAHWDARPAYSSGANSGFTVPYSMGNCAAVACK